VSSIRWRFAVTLSLVLVILVSTAAFARDFDSVPSHWQVKPGDTLDKSDADVKLFRSDGSQGRSDGYLTLDASYSGTTNIWFDYNWGVSDSGPVGYGVTWVTGVNAVDMLRAYTRLYDRPIGYEDWDLIDSAIATQYDSDTSGEAWVERLTYSPAAPAYIGFRGTTSHRVVDSELGWNWLFGTADVF